MNGYSANVCRLRRRLSERWKDDVEKEWKIEKSCGRAEEARVDTGRVLAADVDTWRSLVPEAKTHEGLWWKWKKRNKVEKAHRLPLLLTHRANLLWAIKKTSGNFLKGCVNASACAWGERFL